ncbi:MAG: DUF1007 family protein [Paracoccus sp. (in: a-proteobacteria)]|uniref:DUF1007 family protein n=1 Tax=Paracoccus sp. TaxID=267 RepID=UPI0026DEC027|nr:DUF1007 family protein [Paracoccus sp. (in: a-proteobacteria)]MDO5614327.1 DUF1007 family protein [Paracoccus sp. (in: a-proteobacteria)]
MMRLALAFAMLAGAAVAHPHHYTEQQVSLTLGPEGIRAEISIIPSDREGAAIFAALDLDGDGALSEAEMQALAAQVLAATRLTLNDAPQALTLTGVSRPAEADMAAGHAKITLLAEAAHPLAPGENFGFSIAYDRFASEWSVQPWLAEGFLPDGQLPVIRRGADNASVTVTLPE